ncbi:MAG: hypothetical protein RBS80_04515 [Thermoguttaceae bacterium]|jgi:predicted negative regulator of RcsB-dependent stress response|nr:hypothetical protein [Thermoguttaceae bacterium]
MKSERRHELEHNVLADWLADTLQQIKPYQNAILGGLILVVGIIVAVSLWRNMVQRQTTLAWEDYFRAVQSGQPGELEDLISRYPGSQVAHWAAAGVADIRLATGCDLLFSDKPSAMDELRRAVDLYLPVLQQSREAILLQRGTFGLARAYEAQIDLDKAVERYEELVQRWPDGPFAEVAGARLAALQDRSVRELADRFAKWEPKPAVSDLPDFPASRPQFDLDSLPDGPVFTPKTDFGLEGLDGATLSDVPAKEPAEPSDEPAGEPTEPTDEPAEASAEPEAGAAQEEPAP